MSTPHDARMTTRDNGLGQALSTLPAPPAPDLWPQLARRAERARPARRALRLGLPLALAAALVLALTLWPDRKPADRAADTPALAAVPHQAGARRSPLPALRQRSQRLEDWVRVLDAQGAPLDGPSLASATRLEDMIGLVDMQLASSHDAPQVQAALWKQRVDLLQQLAALHLGDARLTAAATDGRDRPRLILN